MVLVRRANAPGFDSLYLIFKNQAGVLYLDLKHEAIAQCFRSYKAQAASFLDVF